MNNEELITQRILELRQQLENALFNKDDTYRLIRINMDWYKSLTGRDFEVMQ